MEARTSQRFAEDAGAGVRTPRLRLHMEQQHTHQAALFADAGYRIVRYYNEMHRPLGTASPKSSWTPGWNS